MPWQRMFFQGNEAEQLDSHTYLSDRGNEPLSGLLVWVFHLQNTHSPKPEKAKKSFLISLLTHLYFIILYCLALILIMEVPYKAVTK